MNILINIRYCDFCMCKLILEAFIDLGDKKMGSP